MAGGESEPSAPDAALVTRVSGPNVVSREEAGSAGPESGDTGPTNVVQAKAVPSAAARASGPVSRKEKEAAPASTRAKVKSSSVVPDVTPEPLDSAPPSIPSAAQADPNRFASALPSTERIQILPGHVIAHRYEVLGVVGEGGMGIVYRCRDRANGELCALKRVIPPEGKLAPDYIAWFYKEARALASLDHPCVVQARDFGQLADGSPYLVMNFVSGVSLHDLTYTKMSFPLIWSIVDQVLSALGHAHARRVIHGDLKPSNVIVEERDAAPPRVHMLDFGLAWLKEDPHDQRLDGEAPMEFAPHAGAGTPGYMAPEQIMHHMHHVEGATDLYSVGCILFKAVSGKAPFSGDPKELLRKHAYDEAPLPELPPAFPVGVAEFIQRLLAKQPWDRFQFAAEARRTWAGFKPKHPQASEWAFPRLPASSHKNVVRTESETGARSIGGRSVTETPTGLLSIRPSPLVGRVEIREQLLPIYEEVAAGKGPPHRLVILVGRAGVGKTRIAEWLHSTIHEDGRMVPLFSRYRPLRGTMDGMLGAVTQYYNFERSDRDTIERSLIQRWKVRENDEKGRAWVAGAAEWLRPTASGSEYRVGPSGVRFSIDSLETRRLVIRHTIRRIANGRPLFFFLDDLHNASDTTLDGFIRIHDTETDQRILMVATVRSEEVEVRGEVAERLRNLREKLNGQVLEVNPLDRDRTCELLRAALPLDDDAVNEAARRSHGFPLFALQQLYAWAHAGDLEYSSGIYRVPKHVLAVRPKTTAELWDARLSALPQPYRDAAYAVSPLGVDVRRTVLHALLQALKFPVEETVVRLQQAEILLPRGADRYSWPHALLQEHLFQRLSERTDAQALFRAAAAALETHPLANTRRVVRQIVVNLLYADETDAAADRFFGFLEQGWNGSQQPASTLTDLELFRDRLTGRNQALAWRWRGEALHQLGQTTESSSSAEQALQLFDRLGDQFNVAQCQRLLGQIVSGRGDAKEGLRLITRAFELFEREKSVLGMAHCQAAAGEIEYLQGDFEQARHMAEGAEANFLEIGERLGQAQCLLLQSFIAHSEGSPTRARALGQEARTAFERTGYRVGVAESTAALAHIDHRLMNYYSAAAGARDALGIFESLRLLPKQASCERLLAMIAIDSDDVDAAQFHAERSRHLCEQVGERWGIVEAEVLQAQVALCRRELVQAEQALKRAMDRDADELEPKQHVLLTRAWLELERGDTSKALNLLMEAQGVFTDPAQAGDHAPQLLARLSRRIWKDKEALPMIEHWRQRIDERKREGAL